MVPTAADASTASWRTCGSWTNQDAWMKYTVTRPSGQTAPSCRQMMRVARYFASHPADGGYRGWRMRSQRSISDGKAYGLVAQFNKGRAVFKLRAENTCTTPADPDFYVDGNGDCTIDE